MSKFVRFIVIALGGLSGSVWATTAPVCFYSSMQPGNSPLVSGSMTVNCTFKQGVKPPSKYKQLCTGKDVTFPIGPTDHFSINDPQILTEHGVASYSGQTSLRECKESFSSIDAMKSFYQQYRGRSFGCDSTAAPQFKIIPGATCTDSGPQSLLKRAGL